MDERLRQFHVRRGARINNPAKFFWAQSPIRKLMRFTENAMERRPGFSELFPPITPDPAFPSGGLFNSKGQLIVPLASRPSVVFKDFR